MRRYIRANTPGGSYFFTLALQDRGASTLVDHVDELRSAVQQVRSKHPFRVEAMVVLPEHLHALWTLPQDDADFSKRWMLIKQMFTRRVGGASAARGSKGERNLWQRRYWEHQIRDDNDFASHVDYIHFNPVKHRLVRCAGDWPHSSFHRYVREGKMPADWGLAAEQPGRYGE